MDEFLSEFSVCSGLRLRPALLQVTGNHVHVAERSHGRAGFGGLRFFCDLLVFPPQLGRLPEVPEAGYLGGLPSPDTHKVVVSTVCVTCDKWGRTTFSHANSDASQKCS